MISAPGVPGVAFGTLRDGDGRMDRTNRDAISRRAGIAAEWATVTQVHGATIVSVDGPGHYGEADGLVTTTPRLPLVVATADCVPVALVGQRSVGMVHAGWRGVAAGVIPEAVSLIERQGDNLVSAVIGPHIGACCYEVGQEVVDAIGGHQSTTTWGTRSADLGSAIRSQLPDVAVSSTGQCTMHDPSYASHRQDATPKRQVAIAWIP
jgi:YfiH family protein